MSSTPPSTGSWISPCLLCTANDPLGYCEVDPFIRTEIRRGFEVYELKTRDRDAMLQLIADLSEHQPRDCIDREDTGICRYEPQ